jgi:hypothetical protein
MIEFIPRATIIQPNRPSLGYVHQQNVYSPPVIRGTFSSRLPFFSLPDDSYPSIELPMNHSTELFCHIFVVNSY